MKLDFVRKLVLDHSGDDLCGASSFAEAVNDAASLTESIDCSLADEIDVIVSVGDLGYGPATKLHVVGRCSSASDPQPGDAGVWSTLNTESVDVETGVARVVTYQAEFTLNGVGQISVTFPCRERFFSAVVWVDIGNGARGKVFFYRRED